MACTGRRVAWFESPGRLARAVGEALRRAGCSVASQSGPGWALVAADCPGCRVTLRARLEGPVPGLGVLSRLAWEGGYGVVEVAVEAVGECGGACGAVEAALFRAGG